MSLSKKTIKKISLELMLWLISLLILIPFMLVILNSFKDKGSAALVNIKWPEEFHFENYKRVVIEGKLLRSFLNSALFSTVSVTISMFLASLAAFVLSRRKSRSTKVIYYYFLLGLVAPLNMVTIIKSLQILHIMNTYLGIILLFSVLLLPFSIFLYYGFLDRVPRSLDESAIIDGCTPFRLFIYIVFPLLKPVTLTVMVINFMNAWNDFMLPLYILGDSRKWPMTLAVFNFFGRRSSEWNLVFADVVLTVLPVALVYAIGQKYLVSGLTAGSVKE